MKTLVHVLKAGDSLLIDGQRVVVKLESKSGQRARLVVTAEDDVKIQLKAESDKPMAMVPH
jgi:hypothetical protein